MYGLGAAVVLAGGSRRFADAVRPALPLALVATLVGWVLAVVDPLGGPAWTVADRIAPTTVTGGAVSPLAELAGLLDRPDHVVFTARADAPVTRWPLVVLDGYDGAGFTSGARYRPLGADCHPTPPYRAGAARHRGRRGGRRVARAVAARAGRGALRRGSAPGDRPGERQPATPRRRRGRPVPAQLVHRDAGARQLVDAAVDPEAAGTEVDGALPAAVTTAATGALHGAPPSFATALLLERWFRDNYQFAGGDQRPTGSGDVQLVRFLTDTKTGTSEQFTAAYVLMARSVGIPARLVVGFRPAPAGPDGVQVVRNGDASAWPEVAVAGVGWVPLDPTGGAAR